MVVAVGRVWQDYVWIFLVRFWFRGLQNPLVRRPALRAGAGLARARLNAAPRQVLREDMEEPYDRILSLGMALIEAKKKQAAESQKSK